MKLVLDHLGHAFEGALVAIPFVWATWSQLGNTWGLFVACFFGACIAGALREIDQLRRAEHKTYWYWDRTWDTLAHGAGGLIVWGAWRVWG